VDGPQLVGKTTNNEGQLVTVTTQRKGALNYVAPNPTATKTVEVSREDAESLVERVVDSPRVFAGEAITIEKPDNVPPKFRATIPTQTVEESIAGTVETPELSINEISKSEQQVTEFVKRVRTTNRSSSVIPEEPLLPAGNAGFVGQNSQQITGAEFVTELGGGFANVIETYPFVKFTDYKNIKPEFGTISDQIEDLGDGTTVRRQVKLPKSDYISGESSDFWNDGGNLFVGPSLPILNGQDYDEELDIVIPYKQVVAEPSQKSLVEGERRRVTPRDVVHSVVQKYNLEDVQASLDAYYWEIPDMIAISLPNKLKEAFVVYSYSTAEETSPSASGDTYSYSQSNRGSIKGDIIFKIEEGFSGNIPVTRCIFFLEKSKSSSDFVLERVRQERGNNNIKFWPNARPASHEIVLFGREYSKDSSTSVSFDSAATSSSNSSSIVASRASIPPTIHDRINIFGDDNFNGQIDSGESGLLIDVNPTFLPATEYPQFPTGEFIYQINASPYKFSYVRVDALVVNITADYV
jgi:hypothetical protein